MLSNPEGMLADRLKAAWRSVDAGLASADEITARQERWVEEYRDGWRAALQVRSDRDFATSLREELAAFTGKSLDEVARRCTRAVQAVAEQWRRQVDPSSRVSIEQYYDGSEEYLYDLTEWHGLAFDDSPLGYVSALDFALRRGRGNYLDFGSGVGAGALLFA